MLNKIAVCVYTQEYWGETMDIEFFLASWVPDLMQLLLFWLVLRTLGKSAKNAAESFLKANICYEHNQLKLSHTIIGCA